jgi:hypothetical protein
MTRAERMVKASRNRDSASSKCARRAHKPICSKRNFGMAHAQRSGPSGTPADQSGWVTCPNDWSVWCVVHYPLKRADEQYRQIDQPPHPDVLARLQIGAAILE